jgi:uncharacterized membrane protein YvbJ
MDCPKCNKQNAGEAKFCIKCGSALGGNVSDANFSPSLAAVPGEQPVLKNKFFLISLAAVVIVLAAGGISLSPQSNTPSGAVKKMFQIVEKGSYNEFKNMYSQDAQQTASSIGYDLSVFYSQARQEVNNKKGVKKFDITEEEITGDTARVCYKVEYGDSSTDANCGNLIKENSVWKLAD